jgi:cytochrome c oxidase assembly protein subunit 15
MFAYALALLVAAIALLNLRASTDLRVKWGAGAMAVALVCQVTLGISTLLTHVAVPVAAAHQGGAVVLLTAVLFFSHARLTERSRL